LYANEAYSVPGLEKGINHLEVGSPTTILESHEDMFVSDLRESNKEQPSQQTQIL
jgi:hypothetical protein